MQWRTNGTGSWTAAGWTGGATTTTVTGLTNNTTYEFQVEATTSYGTSPWTASTLGTPRQWAQVSVGYQHTCAVTVSGGPTAGGTTPAARSATAPSASTGCTPVPVDTSTGLTTTNVASISAAASSWDGTSGTPARSRTTGPGVLLGPEQLRQLGDGTSTRRLTPHRGEHHHRPDHDQRRADQRGQRLDLRGHHRGGRRTAGVTTTAVSWAPSRLAHHCPTPWTPPPG